MESTQSAAVPLVENTDQPVVSSGTELHTDNKPVNGDGPKPTEPQASKSPVASAVPEKYELKLPDGSLLDPKAIEGIAAFAKEQGLSQTQAEKLLMRDHEAMARFVEGQNEQLQKSSQQWAEQVKEDQEIGGEKLQESLDSARRFIKQFGSEKLVSELETSGLGNHPELVRLCARAGKLLANDKLVTGNAGNASKSIEEVFYGKNE